MCKTSFEAWNPLKNETFCSECTYKGLLINSVYFGQQQITPPTVVQEKQCYNICGRWDPADPALANLNLETPRDAEMFMTVAVDLVIRRIQEPVRFQIETSVKVFPQNERFWYFTKRNLVQQFYLNSKEVSTFPIVHFRNF